MGCLNCMNSIKAFLMFKIKMSISSQQVLTILTEFHHSIIIACQDQYIFMSSTHIKVTNFCISITLESIVSKESLQYYTTSQKVKDLRILVDI